MALASFRRRIVRRVDVQPSSRTVQVDMHLGARLERKQRALQQIASDPYMVEAILRDAMRDTFVKAFRERFLSQLGLATRMEVDRRSNPAPVRRTDETLRTMRDRFEAAINAYNAVDVNSRFNRPSEATELRRRIDETRRAYMESVHSRYAPGRQKKRKRLETKGQEMLFRSLALDILAIVSASPQTSRFSRTQATTPSSGDIGKRGPGAGGLGQINVGFGPMAQVERIPTPTANPKQKRRQRFGILWRHLEFGTGIYATDKSVNASSRYRTAGGGWWFGYSEGYSLHLRGSRPMSALRNPRTQLPYSGDAVRFRSVFAARMKQLLNG